MALSNPGYRPGKLRYIATDSDKTVEHDRLATILSDEAPDCRTCYTCIRIALPRLEYQAVQLC